MGQLEVVDGHQLDVGGIEVGLHRLVPVTLSLGFHRCLEKINHLLEHQVNSPSTRGVCLHKGRGDFVAPHHMLGLLKVFSSQVAAKVFSEACGRLGCPPDVLTIKEPGKFL